MTGGVTGAVACGTAAWILILGVYGIVTSRNLVHAVVCLSVAQSSTYVLLLTVGYRRGGTAPVFSDIPPDPRTHTVDPLVQAMTLTDVVVGATVTALLLALALQVARRRGTLVPDELRSLETAAGMTAESEQTAASGRSAPPERPGSPGEGGG